LALPNGNLIAGGRFSQMGGVPANLVARWDGSQWSAMGDGVGGSANNPRVSSLVLNPAGEVIAGGWFGAGLSPARWNGTEWLPLAVGVDGSVETMVFTPEHLVVGGNFWRTGAHVSAYIARWGCPCWANCDNSTAAPVLNGADFACFLQQFAAGNPYANCDASTVPPVVNVADFACFVRRFAAGCAD
jgi:trimeric autotransporter adhesin